MLSQPILLALRSLRPLAGALALAACGPVEGARSSMAVAHRVEAICAPLAPRRTPPAPSAALQEAQDANYSLSVCMYQNALAFAGEHESADVLGKTISDICVNDALRAQVADQIVIHGPGHQTTDSEITEYRNRIDREGMTDIVRVRAGHCSAQS